MNKPVINHEEAIALALMREEASNLARCYLQLRAELAVKEAELEAEKNKIVEHYHTQAEREEKEEGK